MNSIAFIRPTWSPASIALMVLGFVIWWPLGLAMLAYILWGEKFGPQVEQGLRQARSSFSGCCARKGFAANGFAKTGNAAFDDYRDKELARLDEERRRLDEERSEFEAFVHNLRKAKDMEEFEHFKAERRKTVD